MQNNTIETQKQKGRIMCEFNGEFLPLTFVTSVRVKQIEVEQSPCEAKASWVDGNKLPDHQGG